MSGILWSSASTGCTARTGRPFETRYPLLLLGITMESVPQRSRVIASCALHARRRSAHRHKIPRVPTRSGDRQYERSEWTAHYCFAAGWARYLGGGRPGTSVASSSNQGCAELDKEATRRLDGEACNGASWQRASAHS